MQQKDSRFTGTVLVFVRLMLLVGGALGGAACSPSNAPASHPDRRAGGAEAAGELALNRKADGYRGIWYMNQPLDNKYRFKYSGGLATYTAKHRPFAVYSEEANKTFFVYGGAAKGFNRHLDLDEVQGRDTTGALLHMVSYYDHATGRVARPTILLDKRTWDAHDNPVLALDEEGYLWVFSTSHGRSRPSYIHRSRAPYDISAFERVRATRKKGDRRVPIDNFSYMQVWNAPASGFLAFFTRYDYPVDRTPAYMTSPDGKQWSEWKRIATMGEGHYQVSMASSKKAGTTFNYHPEGKGVNWRTNLYYVETEDLGNSWQTAGGAPVNLPLTQVQNAALVHDYQREGLLVYLNDLRFDGEGHPVILFVTSKGYASGPQNGPRTWRTAHWTGTRWEIRPVTTSDNNYDMGPLYLEAGGTWRIIAPTEPGPQRFNPGGEVAMWVSEDRGRTWRKARQLTLGSPYNHTYVRHPVQAHPDFYALWADGHGRKPSASRLYFSTREGDVYRLPPNMEGASARPQRLR